MFSNFFLYAKFIIKLYKYKKHTKEPQRLYYETIAVKIISKKFINSIDKKRDTCYNKDS